MADSLLAIADSSNNDVVIQTTGIDPINPIFATITAAQGISAPQDVKFDSRGNLFVANYNANTITEYAPPYTGSPIATIGGLDSPNQITLSPDGKYLAVVNSAPPWVYTYPLPYANQAPLFVASNALSAAFDGDNLWVGTFSSGVVEYQGSSPTGLAAVSGVSTPNAVAFDSSNDMYVANSGASDVTEYTSSSFYSSVAYSVPLAGASWLQPAGQNIVACGSSAAGVYDATLTIAAPLNSGTAPCHAAYDDQDVIWVTQPDVGIILGYPYPYTSFTPQSAGLTTPNAIAAFPSGT
jgi:sugar lactone lactonase YvrE